MKKINVAQVVNQLSIGGTEKTIEVFAHHLDKSIFDVSIYALFAGGARYDRLQKAFKTRLINGDQAGLVKRFREDQIDILHLHRSGYEEPFALEAAQKAGVPVIVETKIFGGVDNSPSGKLIDKSIFVSKMCALRYLKKQHLTVDEFFKKNVVLYNPIELDNYQISADEILAFKASLGIKASDFVLGRISRPDPFKFGDVCLKMLPYLLQDVPNIKYIIVGCPPSKIKIIQQLRLEKQIILIPVISDEKELSLFYNSLDVYAYSAFHGESFGITIAEAMAHRKPVIVNSTPAIDNAQVELVDHGENGFIANRPFNYAKAVAYLLKNPSLREKMGQNGYQKGNRLYNADIITSYLEKLYIELIEKKKAFHPNDWAEKYKALAIHPTSAELADFDREYALRKKKQFDQFSILDWGAALFKRIFYNYEISSTANPKLSVLLIVLNEGETIRSWLEHVSFLNPYEIIIVDSGSTDDTINIIKTYENKLNLKIFSHPLEDSFADQRNFAKNYCSGDWILTLDADERLSKNSFALLPHLMLDSSALAFSFPRIALFPDSQHFIGDPNGDLQLRLFRNLADIQYIFKVHERPAYRGKPIHPGLLRTNAGWKWCKIKKEIKILHWGYLKPQPALLEKGKRWQIFKEESRKRGIEIGEEDAFILDKNKYKSKPIEAGME